MGKPWGLFDVLEHLLCYEEICSFRILNTNKRWWGHFRFFTSAYSFKLLIKMQSILTVPWIWCCTLTQSLPPNLFSFFSYPSPPQSHLTSCSHSLSICLCCLWSTQFDLSLGRSAQNLMDFLQSNLTSSLFIAVLYPADLIFTRPPPTPPHSAAFSTLAPRKLVHQNSKCTAG